MTVMRKGHRESVVCELCLERPRTAALGRAVRRERVRTSAGAINVRRAQPLPAAKAAEAPVAL